MLKTRISEQTAHTLTFTLRCFLGDFAENERIGDDDDDQRDEVDGEDVEHIIGQLVLGSGKEAKRHALGKLGVTRMGFHMEYNTLELI